MTDHWDPPRRGRRRPWLRWLLTAVEWTAGALAVAGLVYAAWVLA